MDTFTHDSEPVPFPQDLDWFTVLLLEQPRKAVQTPPVVAIVAELLDILNDERISDNDAHHALRRAVQWLRVFTTDEARSPSKVADGREYTPSTNGLAAAAASRQFATTWLRGTPQAAIRTEPVIAVVRRLALDLQYAIGSREAQTRLRHAVSLLSVFVTDEQTPPRR